MFIKIQYYKIEQDEQLIESMLKCQYKQKMSEEMHEIFENLEEGIIVLKNNTVNFTNNNFIDILKQTKVLSNDVFILDDTLIYNKIFKLVRGNKEDPSIYNPQSSQFSHF